jgi:integrase
MTAAVVSMTAGAASYPTNLTTTERAALATALAPRQLCAPLRAARRVLRPFLAPLDDAGVELGLPQHARHVLQRGVLAGMQEHGTPWPAWDAGTWIAVAGAAGNRGGASILGIATHLGALTGRELVSARADPIHLTRRLFGRAVFERELGRVQEYLRTVGYGRTAGYRQSVPSALATLFLQVGRAELGAVTLDVIESAHAAEPPKSGRRTAYFRIARVLHGMGILPRSMSRSGNVYQPLADVNPEWAGWCARWRSLSTLAPTTAETIYGCILRAGRWLAHNHPDVCSPDGWTRDLAVEYVAAVSHAVRGDLVAGGVDYVANKGEPLSASSKYQYLAALRIFLRDCQEWGWCARHFDPARALATPRAVKALIGPNPRVIANDAWAKLLWAGLHVNDADLPSTRADPRHPHERRTAYPLALIRATAIAWLFAGLRSDELVRLRVGCVRWQRPGAPAAANSHGAGDDATCLLDVPTHKTGTSYTKPVDPLLGDAIGAWEALRPEQPLLIDRKTGERVAILFCFRGQPFHTRYFNKTLIPLLCRKAGLPLEDARGRITSHRARATIASQLYNAKEPMTLFELQAWLGHRSPETTQHYARITPTTLAKAYRDAGYFARNVRTVEVLIDREAVGNGAAATGAPWQYFDLGHGFCTYSFFEQCPHRMACARCDFYLPKQSTRAQLLEARGNLQRMLAQIPLTDDERAAVEDGATAVNQLIKRLHDVPTPAGPTPRDLAQPSFIPIDALVRPSAQHAATDL